jgi:DnaK suppressor protein
MAPYDERSEKYRQVLLTLRERVAGSVDHVVDAINDDADNAANLSSVPLHLADVAQSGIVSDVQVLDNENNLLLSIDNALERLAEGAYGVCESCNQEIAVERLQTLPFATKCTHCATIEERRSSQRPK